MISSDGTVIVSKLPPRAQLRLSFKQAVHATEQTTFDELYDNMIDYLGGLDKLVPCLPFDFKTLQQAYEQDKNFNTLSLKAWDRSAGYAFSGHNKQDLPSSLRELLLINGICIYSASECVCLLKQTARRWVESKNKS